MDSARRIRGFTVIELMITLAIAAILFTQVIPSFAHLIRSTQLATQKNTFVKAMHFARSEAVKRGRHVKVCAREGEQCSDDNLWHQGWIVFVDKNRNDVADDDEVLKHFDALADDYTLRSNASRHFSNMRFLPDGRMRRGNGALPMMTFRLCAPDTLAHEVKSKAYEIVINAGGRVRVQSGVSGKTDCSADVEGQAAVRVD